MEGVIRKIFLDNFFRKVFSVLIACIVWFAVEQSIIVSKTFPNVLVRIVNIPHDKTIIGLMPNGVLNNKISLTLIGNKDVVSHLEADDFEIILDASDQKDDWLVKIHKKDVVPFDTELNLMHNIFRVEHSEILLKFTRLVTEKIPVIINEPIGEAPIGYQLVGVWPRRLSQTISGPEEEVKQLKNEGLELTFDLGSISKDDLDQLLAIADKPSEEVSFYIPNAWKRINIPLLGPIPQELNALEARNLRIDFIRDDILSIPCNVPIRIFYPSETLDKINLLAHPLKKPEWILERSGVWIVDKKLFIRNVSKTFLDIVRDRLEIVIVADESRAKNLAWNMVVVNRFDLEETYVRRMMGSYYDMNGRTENKIQHQERETTFRKLFRHYARGLQVYSDKRNPFVMRAKLEKDGIKIEDLSHN